VQALMIDWRGCRSFAGSDQINRIATGVDHRRAGNADIRYAGVVIVIRGLKGFTG
jgi:hypothetical protein